MVNVNIDDEILEAVKDVTIIEMKNIIKDIVDIAIKNENLINKDISVTITAATKDEIHALNKQYRNVDRETDVLSFPIFTLEELKKISFNEIELGDIIVCLDVVRKQSAEYETGMKRELLYMITHGICHLLGYDHIIDEDKKIMRKKEEEILEKIGV